MLAQRLSLALERKIVSLPENGKIAVVSPDAGTELSALPRNRTEVVSRSFRVHRAFTESGFRVVAVPEGPYAMAILSLPRAKAAAQAALAEITPVTRGPTVIDGQKTDGVESLQRELGRRATLGEVLVKAHGRMFAATNVDCTGWNAVPDQVTRPKGLARFRPTASTPDPAPSRMPCPAGWTAMSLTWGRAGATWQMQFWTALAWTRWIWSRTTSPRWTLPGRIWMMRAPGFTGPMR